MNNGEVSSVLEAQQRQSQLRDILNYQTVGMYEQQPRQHRLGNDYNSALIVTSIVDVDPDLYVQKEPKRHFQSNEQLTKLQRSYTLLTDATQIAEVLAQVPPLYALLNAAVEPLRAVFGDKKLLLLEALTSDDDTVLRVIVKLSKDTRTPSVLMRKFKLDWWLNNCSRSGASLVFDYEIGNGF